MVNGKEVKTGLIVGLNHGHAKSHPPLGEASCVAHEGPPQQAYCLRSGHCQGGLWPRTIRAPRYRITPQQQGQACTQAREEETRNFRPCEAQG